MTDMTVLERCNLCNRPTKYTLVGVAISTAVSAPCPGCGQVDLPAQSAENPVCPNDPKHPMSPPRTISSCEVCYDTSVRVESAERPKEQAFEEVVLMCGDGPDDPGRVLGTIKQPAPAREARPQRTEPIEAILEEIRHQGCQCDLLHGITCGIHAMLAKLRLALKAEAQPSATEKIKQVLKRFDSDPEFGIVAAMSAVRAALGRGETIKEKE